VEKQSVLAHQLSERSRVNSNRKKQA
jgi:hypothetical protein